MDSIATLATLFGNVTSGSRPYNNLTNTEKQAIHNWSDVMQNIFYTCYVFSHGTVGSRDNYRGRYDYEIEFPESSSIPGCLYTELEQHFEYNIKSILQESVTSQINYDNYPQLTNWISRYADDLSNHYYQDESFEFQFLDYESENDLDAEFNNETDGGDNEGDNGGDDNVGIENSDNEEPEADDNNGNNSSFPVFSNDLLIF